MIASDHKHRTDKNQVLLVKIVDYLVFKINKDEHKDIELI